MNEIKRVLDRQAGIIRNDEMIPTLDCAECEDRGWVVMNVPLRIKYDPEIVSRWTEICGPCTACEKGKRALRK